MWKYHYRYTTDLEALNDHLLRHSYANSNIYNCNVEKLCLHCKIIQYDDKIILWNDFKWKLQQTNTSHSTNVIENDICHSDDFNDQTDEINLHNNNTNQNSGRFNNNSRFDNNNPTNVPSIFQCRICTRNHTNNFWPVYKFHQF